jgi:hypothetical protein
MSAQRTRVINAAFGMALSPHEIVRAFADEDIDLIVAWMEHEA